MNTLKWLPAREPLPSVGVMVTNNKSTIERLLALDDDRLMLLRGSYCDNVIVLFGPEASLPWFPGAIYLGKETLAPNLLIPTNMIPSLPIDWVSRAIKNQFGDGMYVIDPFTHHVYNVSDALTVSSNKLRELLNEAS